MRKLLIVLIATLVAVSAFVPAAVTADVAQESECEYPLTVTDATGEEVTIEEPPESVVALAASDAQTVFEIGADDRLDGMPHTDATSELDRDDKTDISDGWEINDEQVIALEPDLVLAANITSHDDIETLRDAGLTVYHFHEAESIADVRENVFRTGELTGECEGAQGTVDWMDEQLEIVETALEGEDRPLAYYAMGEDGTTAGTGTFIHEALETAGLENIAERAGITWYNEINPEMVVEEEPDWIVYPDDRDEPPVPETVETTAAYQNGNFVVVDANQISQPAPQFVNAIVGIVETTHPDAYEQASEELDVDESGDRSDDGSSDQSDDESGDDAMPGFAVPVALAALFVVAGFLTRRR